MRFLSIVNSAVPLPIDALLPEIVDAVRRNPILLLEAEPGAGKTTRVPAALLGAGFGHVYVLEPRRIAARMAARRVAAERGETLGETVGYQVRSEEVSSAKTRLWYMTEGILTRKLLSAARLQPGCAVILDEFHERHLETDLALALLRRMQRKQPELRLVLMSATLAVENLSARLCNAPILKASGRTFPVHVQYTPHSALLLEQQVAVAVESVVKQTTGHILVFVPGAAEIRRAVTACAYIARRDNAKLLPLHGELTPAEQDQAVLPSRERKIICSTNVAESSITIDGVAAVIDTGLARVLTHSPWSGISRLQVEKVSQSSAVQRSGRAGRTGPGLAIRLYSQDDFVRRPVQLVPEILRADLAQTTLQLAVNGLKWADLEWIDEPSEALRTHANELLRLLGTLDAEGAPTALGRAIGSIPVHPRLGRLCFEAAHRGAAREGAELAVRLSEGRIRLDPAEQGHYVSDVDALLVSELPYESKRLKQQILDALPRVRTESSSHGLDKAIACAFPDRIARRRGETLLLANTTSARLDRDSSVRSEFLAALAVDERSDAAIVRIASPVEPDWLLDLFPDAIDTSEEMVWNREAERVEQINAIRYNRLVIDESRSTPRDLIAASALLVSKALEAGWQHLADADEVRAFLMRVRFASFHGVDALPEGELVAKAWSTLAEGLTSLRELRTSASGGAFLAVLEMDLPMHAINEIAPTHVKLPNGRRAKIEYHEHRPPSVASRLQDFFGLAESPAVARGAVPLVVELLAPNRRPVQVTTDLASFWKGLYPQVRKELSRRYPRHAWPEHPA